MDKSIGDMKTIDHSEPKPGAYTLAPGQTLGQYKVVRLLGRGGMGEVCLAKRGGFRSHLALKTIRIFMTACLILVGWQSVSDAEGGNSKEIQVAFGKLTVASRGEDGRPLKSKVGVYDQQNEGRLCGERWTDPKDGTVSFNLKPGTYRVRAAMDNAIERKGIRLTGLIQTAVSVGSQATALPKNERNHGPTPSYVTLQPSGENEYVLCVVAIDQEGDDVDYIWPKSHQFNIEEIEKGKVKLTLLEKIKNLSFTVILRDKKGAETEISVFCSVLETMK